MSGNGEFPERNTAAPYTQPPQGTSRVNIVSCAAHPFKAFVKHYVERMISLSKLLWHLYHARIRPFESEQAETAERVSRKERFDEDMAYFRNALSEDDYKRLDKLLSAQNSLNIIEIADGFAYGFSLGASVMLEVFEGREIIERQAEKPI